MSSKPPQKKNLGIHLFAGGVAGCCEALTCHPLDTIKVRLQLSGGRRVIPGTAVNVKQPQFCENAKLTISQAAGTVVKKPNFITVGVDIVKKESVLALYKGLGAVVSGIVPKMAIRFSSFEWYKSWLADKETKKCSTAGVFLGTFV